MNSLKFGAITTLLALALPLAAAAPAQAAPPNGCSVNPRPPLAAGYDSQNRPLVTYRTLVNCQQGSKVEIKREFWEEDWNGTFFTDGDDEAYPWPANVVISFPPNVSQQTVRYTTLLPRLDGDDAEEMYLKTSFRVTSNGVTSGWSPWQRSSYTKIYH